MPTTPELWRAPRFRLTIALLMTAAIGLRLPGLFTDFGMDEIFSVLLARHAESPGDVFSKLRYDNNHWLNTLYLWLVDVPRYWFVYRLPALVAGAASLPLVAIIAGRRSAQDALVGLVLAGGCTMLVAYATEARGYSLAICFALASVALLERNLRQPRPWTAFAFGLCSALALLSHITALFPYLGCLAWSSAALRRQPKPWQRRLNWLAQLHGLPLVALVALYAVSLRHMVVLGGPVIPLSTELAMLARQTLGVPGDGAWGLAVGAAAMTLCLYEIGALWRNGDDSWLFYAICVVVLPAALTLASPSYLYPRYFALCVPFALLLLASGLVRIGRGGGWRAVLALLLVVLYLGGHGVGIWRFARDGRGRYHQALQEIQARADQTEPTVSGNQDFRLEAIIDFYRSYLDPRHPIVFFRRDQVPAGGTSWFIFDEVDSDQQVADDFEMVDETSGARYRLVRFYPFGDVAGTSWYLLERAKP